MWLEPKQPGWVREHGPRIGLGESFSLQQLEKDFCLTTAQVCVGSSLRRCVAEVTPAFDDLFRRAAADSELETAVADQIGRARVLHHVERILVPHVDDGRSDLDAARPRANGCEKREGGCKLLREVMHAKVGAVSAKLLCRDGQLDRLLQNIARGSRGGVACRSPMTKRKEADFLHGRRVLVATRGREKERARERAREKGRARKSARERAREEERARKSARGRAREEERARKSAAAPLHQVSLRRCAMSPSSILQTTTAKFQDL